MTGAQERAIEILVESVFHEHTQRSAHLVKLLVAHVAQAVQAEREACAKVAEEWQPDGSPAQPDYIGGWEHEQTCVHIAAAIRARASTSEATEPTGEQG